MIRTLMIEDDMLLAVALRLLLEENGHQVQAVCTYRETMMQDFSSYAWTFIYRTEMASIFAGRFAGRGGSQFWC